MPTTITFVPHRVVALDDCGSKIAVVKNSDLLVVLCFSAIGLLASLCLMLSFPLMADIFF